VLRSAPRGSARIETKTLIASRRRCCLCYYVKGIRGERRGQLAHLNQNPTSSGLDDLVWLCLEHHDEFDSRTRQSKNFTRDEVRHHRDRLYRELGVIDTDLPTRPLPYGTNDLVRERYEAALVDVIDASDGQLEYLSSAWRPIISDDEWSRQFFAYKAPNRWDGVCLIERILLRDGRTAIICEQVSRNPGMSITNAVDVGIGLSQTNSFGLNTTHEIQTIRECSSRSNHPTECSRGRVGSR